MSHCHVVIGQTWGMNGIKKTVFFFIKVGTVKFVWHQLFGSSNITNKNDAEFSVSTM